MEKLLHAIFLKSPANLWDAFEAECRTFYSAPAHSFTDLRNRDNKKIRGDIFEDFCILYLKTLKSYDNVWLLKEVPDEVLTRLAMKRQDFGIDIVAEKDGKYTAIQCKYKKQIKVQSVSWKSLSTFYALCLRTGPWEQYIVMTNCNSVRHMGRKTHKDLSICLGTLQGITKEQWTLLCKLDEHTLEGEKPKTAEELRQARLKFFDKTDILGNTQ